MVLKRKKCQAFSPIMGRLQELTMDGIHRQGENHRVVYPSGKPGILHLLCCQGFAVDYYGFTLDALHLQHPRLLQR
jgi:hypothetical protein